MELYNGMSPNGARVGIFLLEKSIEIPTTNIDIMAGETQSESFLKINSLGEVPALMLDDGDIITESVAICRYLEAQHHAPCLFGETAKEQAVIEMWNRRIEQKIFSVLGDVGRHTFELFKDRIKQFPDYAASQRGVFLKNLAWLNDDMSDGRPFIAGDNFSVADITGMAMLLVCGFVQIDIPGELTHVKKWENAMKARPSWPQPPQ